jgi:hypothetical protein
VSNNIEDDFDQQMERLRDPAADGGFVAEHGTLSVLINVELRRGDDARGTARAIARAAQEIAPTGREVYVSIGSDGQHIAAVRQRFTSFKDARGDSR